MPINCSSNALLDTLNKKKDELNNKIAELQSLGAAAMADIQAKADAMKDALLAAVPEPPAIPNFKKELEELRNKVGKELAEAKAALKERWGDALPDIDIDGLMDKVSAAKSLIDNFEEDLTDFATGLAGKVADKFDFCKDVPNIDAPEVVDGKVTKVIDKGPEPTTPAEVPVVVEPVTPTIVAKEKEPSVSGLTTKSYSELLEAVQPYDDAIAALKDSYFRPLYEWTNRSTKLKKKRAWKKLDTFVKNLKMKYVEFYNSEFANSEEKKLIDEFYLGYGEATRALAARKRIDVVDAYYTVGQYSEALSSLSEEEALSRLTREKVKNIEYLIDGLNSARNKIIMETKDFNSKEVDSQVKSLFQQYEKEITEYQNYRAAKSGD